MSANLVNQMVLLFGLIIIGYICNKLKILDDSANAKFSSFLVKIAMPATILNSALNQDFLERITLVKVAGIAVAVFIVVPILSKILTKVFHMSSTYQLMLNYSNLGFMGIPIINSVFGADAVFYDVIFMMVFNIHIFTIGIITLNGKAEEPKVMLKKLASPAVISSIIAFVIVLLHYHAPAPVTTLVNGVGTLTTPLAMIVIGSQLGGVELKKVFSNGKLYLMTFFKLIAWPIIVYLMLRFTIGDTIITKIAAILFGLPVGGNVTMLCSEYDGDTKLAAQGTCVSTILSLITIPIMLAIMAKL